MDTNPTFAELIEKAAKEPILSIVIGAYGWDGYCAPEPDHTESVQNKVIDWATAKELLNYEYISAWGSPQCHAITAWTENYIIFVSQYDGMTHICTIPRNPIDHPPLMPGG